MLAQHVFFALEPCPQLTFVLSETGAHVVLTFLEFTLQLRMAVDFL